MVDALTGLRLVFDISLERTLGFAWKEAKERTSNKGSQTLLTFESLTGNYRPPSSSFFFGFIMNLFEYYRTLIIYMKGPGFFLS